MIAALLLVGCAISPSAATEPLTVRNESVSETLFWSTIAQSRPEGDLEAQGERLRALIEAMPLPDIEQFAAGYDSVMARGYDWGLWGAAYVIHGGASDDGFEYFLGWLLLQGRETFEAALADPDSLAGLIAQDATGPLEFEGLGYIAMEAWSNRTGRSPSELPLGAARPPEPSGMPWEESEAALRSRYPRLWQRFGETPLG